jgi:hypothetical protein
MVLGQPTQEGAVEGDLIRPLGLVTLNFGYAEFAVNRLLGWMREAGLVAATQKAMPLGQKMALLRDALIGIQHEEVRIFLDLLEAGHPLLTRRNALVHACIVAQGRVVSNDGSGRQSRVTSQQMCELAEQIFDWKERLDVMFQKQLLPMLPKWVEEGKYARMDLSGR